MDQSIPWEHYRSLLGVLEQGSLSGAARTLGLTQPTLGRHIAALEVRLGQALFTRSPGGLRPTAAALALLPQAQAMASIAAALERSARSQGQAPEGGLRGVVRLTASEVVGVELLPPLLAQLRQQQPGLQIELLLSNEIQDLLNREADIAVRMSAPQQEQLLARRLGRVVLGLHAHPRYLAARGEPRTLDDLQAQGHSLIGYDRPSVFLRRIVQRWPALERERFALRSDSDLAQLALIRAGAGIGVCQLALARREPHLQRLLPQAFELGLDTWLTMHADLRANPICRLAFDLLAQGLTELLEPT